MTQLLDDLIVPGILERQAVGSVNQAAETYDRLKRRIINLELAPGVQFTESALAQEFGISKTPVREALVRLAGDGLVSSQPRSGYLVTPVTLSDARELCGLRRVLTPPAAALATSNGLPALHADRLLELCELVELPYDPAEPAEIESFISLNLEFEAIIATASGNRRLALAIANLFNNLERILRITLSLRPPPPEPRQARRDIVAAVLNGDCTRAEELTKNRVDAATAEIIDALISAPAISSVNLGS
jgi:DNA-binding GntR family transcriptional regulator